MATGAWGLLLGAAVAGAATAPRLPVWVGTRPAMPGYWVGIGLARIAGDLPAARAAATRNAVADIALQLEAQIQGSSRLRVHEEGSGMSQEYRSEISVHTGGDLKGVEIAGTYEDAEHCWVYARLSMEEFGRRRREQVEAARTQVQALFLQAEKSETVQALGLYLGALVALRQAAGDPLLMQYRGQQLALATEIPLRFQQLLSQVELETAAVGKPLKQGARVEQVLEVRIRLRQGRPLAGLPLHFRFTRGAGALDMAAVTDRQGVGHSVLHQVKGKETIQAVEVRPDLVALGSAEHRALLEQVLAGFAVPSASIALQVQPQTICVTSREANLSQPMSYLGPLVRNRLQRSGRALVEDPAQAELQVVIDATTRPGSCVQGVYFALLDLSLRVTNRVTGEEIYTTGLSQIKGSGTDYGQAGLRAYTRAGDRLEQEVLGQITDHLNH